MSRIAKLAAILFLGCAGVGARGADAGVPEGITIIDMRDETGENSIRGRADRGAPFGPRDTGRYIVMFVSPRGTYASLTGRRGAGCIAWAASDSKTERSIKFGLPPRTATVDRGKPRICQPFTLTFDDTGKVRVQARNKYKRLGGPLREGAQWLEFDKVVPVILQVPLLTPNWTMPAFTRHNIKGLRIGPLPVVSAALKGKASILARAVQRSPLGIRKPFRVRVTSKSAQPGLEKVDGFLAAKQVIDSKTDILYFARLFEKLQVESSFEAFEKTLVGRYGAASHIKSLAHGTTRTYIWLYDLDGKKVEMSFSKTSTSGCLAAREQWLDFKAVGFGDYNHDIGPWGCALVMVLVHDVNGYSRVQVVSGHTLAINHFAKRLEDVSKAQERIKKLEGYKPKL